MPRRRAFKLSLAAFVVITGAWIGSGWVRVFYSTGTTAVGVGQGVVAALDISHYGSPPSDGFGCNVYSWDVAMLPEWVWTPGMRVKIPLWPAALFTGIATLILGVRSRIPPGHCKACRYDLTGNTSGVCPECGTRTGDG